MLFLKGGRFWGNKTSFCCIAFLVSCLSFNGGRGGKSIGGNWAAITSPGPLSGGILAADLSLPLCVN